ncbi:hypothetical protein BGW41_001771, partial [Actinomortierella wolfii]
SDVEAVAWYRKAADQGDAGAQYNLGYMYRNGRGVEQSNIEAVAWYRKAADQGNATAQYELGYMYQKGRGVEQSEIEASAWTSKAAESGIPSAQNSVGWQYDLGQGVKQDDHLAFEWYSKSVSQGNHYAMFNLGSMYELGIYIERDDNKALDLFRAAGDIDPVAPLHTEWLISPHYRTPTSDSDAISLYREGAARGYAAAQHNLGRMYEKGRGVEKDIDQAMEWYKKAANSGHEDSRQRFEFLQRIHGSNIDESAT